MKLNTPALAVMASISILGGNAGAMPILDPNYQDIDSYEVLLNAQNPSQSGTFDITFRASDGSPSVTINNTRTAGNRYLNAGVTYQDILGFVPGGLETIVSANAYFYIRNANGNNDVISIALSDFVLGSSAYQGNASHVVMAGGLDSGGINLLNENGVLSYTVSRDSGSFTLDYAQLQVETVHGGSGGPSPDPVPEGGATAGMLGCAMLVIGAMSRRFKS